MGTDQLGLKVAFYLYPCLLLITLLGAQTLQFYRDRRRARDPRSTPDAIDGERKRHADTVRRSHSRPIWYLQVILCLLLLASIIAGIRQAVVDQPRDDTDRRIEFPLSAYLVGLPLLHPSSLAEMRNLRPLMLASYSTIWPACCRIPKGHGLRELPTAAHG